MLTLRRGRAITLYDGGVGVVLVVVVGLGMWGAGQGVPPRTICVYIYYLYHTRSFPT